MVALKQDQSGLLLDRLLGKQERRGGIETVHLDQEHDGGHAKQERRGGIETGDPGPPGWGRGRSRNAVVALKPPSSPPPPPPLR